MFEALSKRKISEALGVSTRTIDRWVAAGKIKPGRTPGGELVFTGEQRDRLLKERATRPGSKRYRPGAPPPPPEKPLTPEGVGRKQRQPAYQFVQRLILIERIRGGR